MNLTVMIIVLLVCTLLIDFFTYKKDVDKKLDTRTISYLNRSFISDAVTYLLFTLTFSLMYKHFLVGNEYFICNNNCHIEVLNTFFGLLFIIFQLLNIYNFYDSYVHTYMIYTSYQDLFSRIIIVIGCVLVVLFNEFLLSNIDLNIIFFKAGFFNFMLKLVKYSLYIFLPLVIIKREVKRYFYERRIEEIEEDEFIKEL